jgi:leucyl-tRNA synthetase
LIYARFWHKFLFDIGAVSTEEPFPRLEFLGFILAEDGRKMSKRWGNIVNPDDMVARFGADAFRLYEMFIGPFENTVPWKTDGLVGTHRFVERVSKFSQKLSGASSLPAQNILHKTIKKVSEDIEAFKFNTAVSTMMICLNEMERAEAVSASDFKLFLQLLAPFAPHIAEELWKEMGESTSIHHAEWPKFDASKIVETEITIAVQVAGKVRAEFTIQNCFG